MDLQPLTEQVFASSHEVGGATLLEGHVLFLIHGLYSSVLELQLLLPFFRVGVLSYSLEMV